jgi:hypothetical protein
MFRRLVPLLALSGLACVTLGPERRLSLADQAYRVGSVAVVPFSLTYRACADDIDHKARTEDLFGSLTGTASGALRRRGYTVQPLLVDPSDASLKAYYKALDHLLCSGSLPANLPPEIVSFAKAQGVKAKATTVLIGGVSRLRWHLKLDTEQENGLVGSGRGSMGEFTVRASSALLDLQSERVVWTESVEGTILANDYADAIKQLFLFGELRTTDPHDKLFYDFPAFQAPAPTPPVAASSGS